MPWPQLFDGKGWGSKLAVKHGVNSISHLFARRRRQNCREGFAGRRAGGGSGQDIGQALAVSMQQERGHPARCRKTSLCPLRIKKNQHVGRNDETYWQPAGCEASFSERSFGKAGTAIVQNFTEPRRFSQLPRRAGGDARPPKTTPPEGSQASCESDRGVARLRRWACAGLSPN